MSTKSITSLLMLASYFFFSCNKDIVFCDFQSVPDKNWNKQSEFLFQFDLNDASVPYNISLQLRNNAFYPFQNLWIFSETYNSSEIIICDTIEYRLVDEFGKWTGNGISLFQNQFPLQTNYHFPDSGTYTIRICHGMPDERLKGIENIGLLIKKTK